MKGFSLVLTFLGVLAVTAAASSSSATTSRTASGVENSSTSSSNNNNSSNNDDDDSISSSNNGNSTNNNNNNGSSSSSNNSSNNNNNNNNNNDVRGSKSVKVARSPRIDERRHKFHNSMSKNAVSSEAVELKAQQVSKFVSPKNLIKTAIKLMFGSDEESAATSRQIISLLVTVLDMVKTTFGARARAAQQGRGMNGAFDDITIAGASMIKGLLRSAMAKDENCMQRYLCEASKDAVKEGHELGYLVAQFGGYAASYALEKQKNLKFDFSYNATRNGRSGDDCFTLYQTCNEVV